MQASAEATFPLPEGVTLCMLTNWWVSRYAARIDVSEFLYRELGLCALFFRNNAGALIFLALPYNEIGAMGMNLMITGSSQI